MEPVRSGQLANPQAEDEARAFSKAYHGPQGRVDCFGKAVLTGIVTGGGIDAAHAAVSHMDVMKEAYALGLELQAASKQ